MPHFVVTSLGLNLRRTPEVRSGNVIVILNQGQPVETVDTTDENWWEVRTRVQGTDLQGFLSPRYLEAAGVEPQLTPARSIQAVHFPHQAAARTDSAAARHCPLADSTVGRRDVAALPEVRSRSLHRIIEALDVENSQRYRPTASATYCNVYAYDYCYFASAYLPRVWWYSKSLIALAKGQAQPVRYAETVYEINANGLYDWLRQWGEDFGWKRSFELDEVQSHANAGGVALICAQRKNLQRSGHITCVIPETPSHFSNRAAGRVTAPLQSQAGTSNKSIFSQSWWTLRAQDFRAVRFWIHP